MNDVALEILDSFCEVMLSSREKLLFFVRTVDESLHRSMAFKHFMNVLITSILPCIIFSEDSIPWDKYTRYTLSNYRITLRNSYNFEPLLCSFVWKNGTEYTIGCTLSIGGMRNLAELTSLRAGSEFVIEEVNEKSYNFQPCIRIGILIRGDYYCLDEPIRANGQPSFTSCLPTNENQKWKILSVDEGREPAHFLIKTTSTPSKASSLLSKEKFEMFVTNQATSTSVVYVTSQMTQLTATMSSLTVHSTRKSKILGNFHIDSTTTYSADSKTTTGRISATMPTLRCLNWPKFYTYSTNYKNFIFSYSKKSTTMTSSVPPTHTTSEKIIPGTIFSKSMTVNDDPYWLKGQMMNEKREPAHFLTKTMSTLSQASSLLSIEGIETLGGSQVTSTSMEYETNQMTKSSVTMPSLIVGSTTKSAILKLYSCCVSMLFSYTSDQTFGNFHIDSTTPYSTVSKTTTGLISATMRKLESLNRAKFFTNPTGDKHLKHSYSKKSTTITSKNKEVYASPASSTSMYATISYLTKVEAKTPPFMTTMLIPKSYSMACHSDGRDSAVGNQDNTKATSMALNGKNFPSVTAAHLIAETQSVHLLSPLFTVKQCESTCPQELGSLFKNCYHKEHVLYNGTKIPCNPMPETYQIVSKFMNMFGSMWVVGTSMTSAVVTLAMVPKLFVNQIQWGQDIMLGFSHLTIMFFVFRVDNELMCKLTAISLIIFLTIYWSLVLLECICVYISLTNTSNSWNTPLFKFVSFIFILCLTISILTYLICFSNDLPSDYSCWINYNSHISKSILTMAGILFSISMIFIETGISGMHKSLPTLQKKERKVCEISSATLVIKVILSTASSMLTSYAVFSQNFALFPTSFGINVAFGWFNFFAHAICNEEVNALLVKVYFGIRTNLKQICLYIFMKH